VFKIPVKNDALYYSGGTEGELGGSGDARDYQGFMISAWRARLWGEARAEGNVHNLMLACREVCAGKVHGSV